MTLSRSLAGCIWHSFLLVCKPEVKHEKEVTIKCAWLDKTLLDMVAQDQEHSIELQVDIAVEIQGQDPLEFPLPTEAIEEEPHPKDNAKHILQLQEELSKARARIEEQTKHIENLQSELLAKDELIRSLEEKQ
jgi:predicted RNase H-like nuclease (RuvC/YqgF family)